MGQKRGRSEGSFVRETSAQTVTFYRDFVQNLRGRGRHQHRSCARRPPTRRRTPAEPTAPGSCLHGSASRTARRGRTPRVLRRRSPMALGRCQSSPSSRDLASRRPRTSHQTPGRCSLRCRACPTSCSRNRRRRSRTSSRPPAWRFRLRQRLHGVLLCSRRSRSLLGGPSHS